ncbi:CBS domain-containing protein [Pleurocapsales cyanobacterium LEGE 06147]|nr:CBS domain-containing protein [Pleurocapsales cyanobacterium LEGE 06147]
MPQQDPSISLLSLEPAIDRRPLTVSPDTPLLEVITIMGKAHSSCVLPGLGLPLDALLISQARGSTILVTQGSQLLGIFTQKEAVELIASGRNLDLLTIAQVMSPPVIVLTESEESDIFEALSLLRQYQISHLPVVDERGQLTGLVTYNSIHQPLPLDELLKSRQLAEVISTSLISAPETTSILDLARLMAQHKVDFGVLTKAPDHSLPIGIVAQPDLIELFALELDLSQIQARTVMSTPLLYLDADESVLAAYWQMQQEKVQQVIVSEPSGSLLGIVTFCSFLTTLELEAMRKTVEQLQQSIERFEAQKRHPSPSSFVTPELEVPETRSELLEQLKCSRILTAMALRIRESLNLDEILKTAVDEVQQFLKTDRTIVYCFNSDFSGKVVVESVAEGLRPALNSTIQDTCFGKNYAEAYKQGRTQVIEDIYTAGLTQCHIDILVFYDIRASLVVPILQGEHLWGLLCAYNCSGPRSWRDFELDLLKQLATHMAIAIQQSELYQQLETELAERKRAEEQLKLSLREKEILLKEVHHRVKNNLQIISSLLRLQSDYIQDKRALASFKDSQNRIRSMALIHEKLYQSKDLVKIDFAEYLRDLTSNLLHSYGANAQEITLNINVNEIWFTIDTAISCGLIINELVSNSLKHAFPHASSENKVEIDIRPISDNNFRLVVSDNGIGFPQDIDFQNTESLGLQLVCTFVEQLEGTIELELTGGTTFIITFEELGAAGRIKKNG